MEHYDAIVIGTGQAGKPLAGALGKAGRRTAIIEKGRVGGSEIASAIQIAMMGGLTWRDLRDAAFSHPTLTESLNNLFSTIEE